MKHKFIDIYNVAYMIIKYSICTHLMTIRKHIFDHLTLKAPRKNASENAVCWSRLLQIIA